MKNRKKEKRKGLKITLFIWALVILSGAYIGMACFTQTVAAEVPDDPFAGIMDEIEDLPSSDENNADNSDEDDEISIPTGGIDLVNYALDIYNNGKGSQSTISCTITANASMMGRTGAIVQRYYGNTLRCGNKNLEELYFYYKNEEGYNDLIQSTFGNYDVLRNYYRAVYVDHDANTIVCAETENSNYKDMTHTFSKGDRLEISSIQDAMETLVIVNSEAFPLEFEYDSKTETGNVQNVRTDKRSYDDCTLVSFSYNVASLPESFNHYYEYNSALGVVSYTKYDFKFLISKKTGKLLKFVRDEEFSSMGGPAGMPISITTQVHYEQTFKKMDTPVDVSQPYLEHPDYSK